MVIWMTEKRFTICVDSNDLKSLWDNERTEEEPLLWLTLSDRIGGIDDVCELLNELHDKNITLKKDNETLKIKNKNLIKILRNHYIECQKWNDTHTQLIIKQIAQDLKVDLE